MRMELLKRKRSPARRLLQLLAIFSLGGIAVIIFAVTLYYFDGKTINTFEECKAADGTVGNRYPEQCFIDGKSFVNSAQHPVSIDDYLGLSEQAATDKATRDGRPSRVVERDGEGLPVTTDYAPGRVNLHVKEGKVFRVEVEGQ